MNSTPTDISQNNKRIAKNTLYMYLRMAMTLAVSLFTARVVLNALGVHDYGLNNVVGGFVSMLGYFNGLLSSGSSRFLTVGLGRGDIPQLKKTFSACLTIHLGIALLTLLIGETVGLWFLNNKMVFDADRTFAANYVFQLSLISMFLGILQTPYMACITSHERMGVYAYATIFDVVMKLLVVYLLMAIDADKLILYSTFYFVIGIVMFFFWRIYCLHHFEECNMHLRYDGKLYREIFDYVGWNALGGLAFMANNQGVSVLLNLFFGPVVNAARGVAASFCNYINQFVSNFQLAVSPQTFKYYAQNNFAQMNRLVMNNARYSSYLLLFFGIPAFIEVDYVLTLWLGKVPEYTVPFVRLTIVQLLIQSVDFPIGGGIHAFGKMKLPNITSSVVYLSILPLGYLFLRLGATPVIIYAIIVAFYPIAMTFDLWILNKYSSFDWRCFVRDVLLRTTLITTVAAALPGALHMAMPAGLLRFLCVCSLSLLCSTAAIYALGLSPNMRRRMINLVERKTHISLHWLLRV